MTEQTNGTVERKTQYERGREDTMKEFRLLLMISLDAYPKTPSAYTLACFGEGAAALSEEINAHLGRFEKAIKRQKAEAAA